MYFWIMKNVKFSWGYSICQPEPAISQKKTTTHKQKKTSTGIFNFMVFLPHDNKMGSCMLVTPVFTTPVLETHQQYTFWLFPWPVSSLGISANKLNQACLIGNTSKMCTFWCASSNRVEKHLVTPPWPLFYYCKKKK